MHCSRLTRCTTARTQLGQLLDAGGEPVTAAAPTPPPRLLRLHCLPAFKCVVFICSLPRAARLPARGCRSDARFRTSTSCVGDVAALRAQVTFEALGKKTATASSSSRRHKRGLISSAFTPPRPVKERPACLRCRCRRCFGQWLSAVVGTAVNAVMHAMFIYNDHRVSEQPRPCTACRLGLCLPASGPHCFSP
eukprot:COSAG01_NODE_582_length_15201_cov_7.218315_7_plen_193_part_00